MHSSRIKIQSTWALRNECEDSRILAELIGLAVKNASRVGKDVSRPQNRHTLKRLPAIQSKSPPKIDKGADPWRQTQRRLARSGFTSFVISVVERPKSTRPAN